MNAIQHLCQWVYDWPQVEALRESDQVFPLVETVHVLAIALIVGTIVTVDLRLIGLVLRQEPAERVARALLPYTWWGFVLMLATGVPLFAAESVNLYANPAFRVKLVLLLLAGANALLFHRTAYRRVREWTIGSAAPGYAQIFAYVSILLWSGIVISGRLIAVFRAH
jgi:hypothetical protein